MDKKTKLYVLLLSVLLILLALLFLLDPPDSPRTLSKAAYVAIGLAVGLGRVLFTQRQQKNETEARYRHSYQEFIEGAFADERAQEQKLFQAIRAYNDSQYDAALKTLSALREKCRNDRDRYAVTVFEALCRYDMQQYEEALEKYLEALRLRPSCTLFSNLGLCYQRMGNLRRAEEYYRQAIELDSEKPTPHINLAFLCFRMGRGKEGREHAQRALDIAPLEPKALKAMTLCCYLDGDMEAYQDYYARAVANGVDGKELSSLYIENLAEALADKDGRA